MAPEDGGNAGGGASTAAITAGIVAVLGVVASLSAAGAIQRVLRNHGDMFVFPLALALFGGLLWALSTLLEHPDKDGRAFKIIGALLIAGGGIWAVAITVTTASEAERPAISAAYDPATQRVKVKVSAGNLASDHSIVIFVDGLRKEPPEADWRATSLSQNYAGPDADGKVQMDLDIAIPPGRYEAVGVQAWSQDPPSECVPARGARSKDVVDKKSNTSGAACTIVPIPAARPSVTMAWEGKSREQERAEVTASVPNARSQVVAVDITARRRGGEVQRLQYTLTGPGGTGKASSTTHVAVPPDARNVCAEVLMQAIPPDQRRAPTCPLPQSVVEDPAFAGAYAELVPIGDP